MKKKVDLGKKLSLSKEKLNRLNEEQMNHFMGGRMLFATGYTSGSGGTCSETVSACCSTTVSACCG
jgi:natural product precursor